MNVEQFEKSGSRLIDEVKYHTIIHSTAIIIVVQLVSLIILSSTMGNNLRREAERVADDLALYLSEPMYNVDDQQTILVADSMFSSGRLSVLTFFLLQVVPS